jgi:hypothetical protein
MKKKRPHILKYKLPDLPATRDENLNWVPGAAGADVQLECRYETNGKGETVASNDGSQVVYSGIVYLDVDVDAIEFGTEIEVFKGEALIFKGNAINFSNGQLNSRLWV